MARYGMVMIDDPARPGTADAVEAALRAKLARDEAAAGTVVPILRHLLANEDNSVFSDEIVARVRGMIGDLARQLLESMAERDGATEDADADAIAGLSGILLGHPALLRHVHALALEWQLTERLRARISLDPVLPPLLQALIESDDAETASLAMQLLAAQARFGQAQRRMQLALAELPGDLLHLCLLSLRNAAGAEPECDARAAAAEAGLRAGYDESRGRLGLISRLILGMGAGAVAALAIGHAGAGIFLTALSLASAQDRDAAAFSTSEAQLARLAVALRAAGLKTSAIEEQFLAIHPDAVLPEGLDRLGSDRAAALLALAGR